MSSVSIIIPAYNQATFVGQAIESALGQTHADVEVVAHRDEPRRPAGVIAGRAARASANFRETYPAFVALALALAIAGDPAGYGLAGAWLWFAARLVYLPLYLAGVPYIRSLVWLVALVGLAVMAGVIIL